MHIDRHTFFATIRWHSMLTAVTVWLRRWTHFEERRAAWLQCSRFETSMRYVCMEEEENYKHQL